ncbi:chemotaxis protein [Ectothiorhodospira haloalkaliphila]|uniref:Protein-glutamate methylesterase/protein-glutamine glutaminase n=1 Tax=Ectothiorhodospira haloalkaliphila TaxID=421628 RepID=W8KIH0_9GAMM|nr:chemotaxis response regulator protein-glutamate methylesterase [Ectothiorhodospira haloalkaliphila]MCG5493751.1 chemotaxis response regulator protein-glutamate methylesterase [Ectothiorhodospira variabilis]AHK78973.1 chemotaxis protein [Ectothiorhodospira haloalkaliphila]MCG5497842.1 chemotaxis response regulator protein-glutamate methylesterase [Ectothiorhodospira variabilis]MCG5503950.1 chemotaxis response regulator protein-glutamate methylesterase [Ectothiorhodospira variabilis]MCG550710
MGKPIRVLVVDDSALVRKLLTEVLNSIEGIEVVGTAQDPYVARERIKSLDPDVLTLDVEMPRMDGLTFLRNLMRLRPMPVVMVSSLTERGAEVTMQALELGAVDFVTKPALDLANTLNAYRDELAAKVRVAAGARVRTLAAVKPKHSVDEILPAKAVGHWRTTDRLLAIGASTGGTEAVKDVLIDLPPDSPAVVIAQHIPAGFSGAWAQRMNRQSRLVVKEAEEGERLMAGHAYVAPGDQHLMVARDGARYVCRLNMAEPVNRHRPSVDVLFRSVAQAAGKNACAALLTGMGADGVQGLKELHDMGVETIAQDEATSVVWGMPGEAVKRGAASQVLPLERIAEAMLKASRVR